MGEEQCRISQLCVRHVGTERIRRDAGAPRPPMEDSVMAADAAQLLHSLSETWRALGKDQDKDSGTGVLRACAMTLVVAAAESDDPQEIGAMLSSLMQLHPSRTIVVR